MRHRSVFKILLLPSLPHAPEPIINPSTLPIILPYFVDVSLTAAFLALISVWDFTVDAETVDIVVVPFLNVS